MQLTAHKTLIEEYTKDENNQYQGKYISRYLSGSLCAEIMYADNLRHGEMKAWHENGTLAANYFCYYDVMHGEFKQWNEDGKESAHLLFIDDYVSDESIPTDEEDKLMLSLRYPNLKFFS